MFCRCFTTLSYIQDARTPQFLLSRLRMGAGTQPVLWTHVRGHRADQLTLGARTRFVAESNPLAGSRRP